MSTTQVAVQEAINVKQQIAIEKIDHVHLQVGNAFQAMHYLRSSFGFVPIAYRGLETGSRDELSYVLKQGSALLVVTSSLNPATLIAHHVRVHGDGVKDIAFDVKDASHTFHLALLRGAAPVAEPVTKEDEHGQVTTASVESFGHMVHTFVQRNNYTAAFLPGYQSFHIDGCGLPPLLTELDHLALTVPAGQLNDQGAFYTDVLDFAVTHVENIVTPKSAMKSKVVQNNTATVRFPMMEPEPGRRTSQIEEYLSYNKGPGVQHLAFSCDDIVESVTQLQKRGVAFLKTPGSYYDMLAGRVGNLNHSVEALRALSILADRDEWGYLLQIFTKPITGRPTLFIELIEREGARGFGSGNIRALFDAVEREQALRGNL